MTLQEVNDIMNAVGNFNLQEMEVQDQALYLISVSQFAERMKPLVVKYAEKLPEECKFLFKL